MKTSNLWPSCHWITRCRSLSNWLRSQHWRHSVSIRARKIVLLVVWCTRSKGIGRGKAMLHNRLFLWPIIPLKSERIVKKETLKRKDIFLYYYMRLKSFNITMQSVHCNSVILLNQELIIQTDQLTQAHKTFSQISLSLDQFIFLPFLITSQ